MQSEQKGHTTVLTDTNSNTAAFLEAVTAAYSTYKDQNLVLDLTANGELALEQLLPYLPLSNKHRKAKKSFVLVVPGFDYDEAPDEMVIVPTLQEAHDLIEMEEIERDLGF
ncbi:ribonuclease Z [Flavobacterium akiainvivens]|uniref:Ribonuclease Z n=1 Tax=Flavobacterium akiainvivens TaxID=1202724 RepID=A0A0M9VGW8_9FLAO|nr:hypothetical protein [Flavobacterium akiainvivens]KOS04936.1 ribonuclease Z [Flavobacterium akiainvivens]SFQ41830.1 hypothetical protein SAMN05444144_104130 [Flavobacterium akiainvivens]